MKRIIIGALVGGLLVYAGTNVYDWVETSEYLAKVAAIQTADPTRWLDIQDFSVTGVPPGNTPMTHVVFRVLKPLIARTTISPRSISTGQSICVGRTSSIYEFAPTEIIDKSFPLAALAGLQSCDFPAGEYSVSVTITPTDMETNVQLKPILIEERFAVAK